MKTPIERAWNIAFNWHGLTHRYLFKRRAGRELIVFFPALRRPGLTSSPIYNRLRWCDDYSCSCLFVSDPGLTREASLRGTWFQGSPEHFTPIHIAYDIANIIEEFGLDRSKTVLYGSSQGGFGALATAAYLENARVLAECPQVDLRRFNQPPELNAMARACYGVEKLRNVPAKFNVRLDIAELYQRRKASPFGSFIIRKSDTHHRDVHHARFRELHPTTLTDRIIDDDDAAVGHEALPRELISRTLNDMLAERHA